LRLGLNELQSCAARLVADCHAKEEAEGEEMEDE
jgi:hypothetical protein